MKLQEIQQEIIKCKSQLADTEKRLRYPFSSCLILFVSLASSQKLDFQIILA